MLRKLPIFLVLLIICYLNGQAGSVTRVYKFSAPTINSEGTYSIVSFEGTHLLGEPGKATLPFFPVKLLLPPGEIASSINIKYDLPEKLEGEYILAPRQETRPISEGDRPEMLIDSEFYNSTQTYPLSYIPHVGTQFYNGCGIALSAFTPVRYTPSKREVTWYPEVTVEIITIPDTLRDEHNRNFFASAEKGKLLEEFVQNPEQTEIYFSGREFLTSTYDYLIITKNQFAAEFDTVKHFYERRGIKSKTTTTEVINATVSGTDLQQKIRNYIIQEYDLHGISYVLIGGDVEVVPYRGFYCYVQSGGGYSDSGIPADLYYSALDGSWNTDGDTKWGEPDEDDLYPEVGIGRITFNDTAELHNILHKSFLYQSNPVEGELTRPLLAGEKLYDDPYTTGSGYMNLLIGYCTDNGYSTHGIPPDQPIDTLYDHVGYTWSAATLLSHINSGHPWIHHVGHANNTYVMRLNNSDIINSNFSLVNGTTHNYPIVYTHGCICGSYDYSDCIGERMIGIDNFAVAFIGNSRYGWFNEGTTDGPSEHLHREFMDAIYYDSLYHIGMAHLKSKSETAPFVEVNGEFEPGATRWCFYDNNVLGDPMMAVWTEEPYSVEVQYPAMIAAGAGEIEVQITGPEGACKGFTCSLFRNDTLFGSALTDNTGAATIAIEGELTEGPVSLIVNGFNVLPQWYTIHVCNCWLGYTTDWSDPNNWYSGTIPDSYSYIIIPQSPVGNNFPDSNSGMNRSCKAIFIEQNAHFQIGKDETFSVAGD